MWVAFPIATLDMRKQWSNAFKELNEKDFRWRRVFLAKISIKSEGKIKTSAYTQILKDFIFYVFFLSQETIGECPPLTWSSTRSKRTTWDAGGRSQKTGDEGSPQDDGEVSQQIAVQQAWRATSPGCSRKAKCSRREVPPQNWSFMGSVMSFTVLGTF